MKNTLGIIRTVAGAAVIFLGALIAPPAFAECDLCGAAKNGNEEAIKPVLITAPKFRMR